MKTVFTLLFLTSISFVNAQDTYESPYVIDGKSFKIKVDSKFTHITDEDDMSIFAVDPSMDMDAEEPQSDCIILGTVDNEDDITPEEMLGLLMAPEMIAEGVETEEYTSSNGQTFILAYGNLDFLPESDYTSYMAASIFEEVLVVCMLVDYKDDTESGLEDLKKTINTYEEYATDRENEFVFYDDGWDDYDDGPYFDNSMYETSLDYMFIEFDAAFEESEDNHWEEEMGMDYPELLLAYSYVNPEELETLGGVKVFSGGPGENFRSYDAKLEAVQNVFHGHSIMGFDNMTEVHGDTYTFARYDIRGGKLNDSKYKSLYITHCRGEIVFILAYATHDASYAFIPKLEDFVKSMQYYEELDFED